MHSLIQLAEKGWFPDPVVRVGIRRLLDKRLRQEEANLTPLGPYVDALDAGPIAEHTADANAQHYEVPAAFFQTVLGRRLKYSSAYFPSPATSLDEAEEAMLSMTCERAGLHDGQDILELGCGWGSLTLWMAEHFPRSRILAVSNSASQREYILARARERELSQVEVVTCDMNDFEAGRTFDRVVSVEMFEHMRNWRRLLHRISGWLRPEGQLFVHIFTHRVLRYRFGVEGDDDWMGRYFFTGGQMPSRDLLAQFPAELRVERQWEVNGTHYSRTLEAWLEKTDAHRDRVLEIFRPVYGADTAVWLQRWRLFFLACSELFRYRQGTEWGVTHYRLVRP
jgi:cyclopropane-fatty-acyl-phospholipid synthase